MLLRETDNKAPSIIRSAELLFDVFEIGEVGNDGLFANVASFASPINATGTALCGISREEVRIIPESVL